MVVTILLASVSSFQSTCCCEDVLDEMKNLPCVAPADVFLFLWLLFPFLCRHLLNWTNQTCSTHWIVWKAEDGGLTVPTVQDTQNKGGLHCADPDDWSPNVFGHGWNDAAWLRSRTLMVFYSVGVTIVQSAYMYVNVTPRFIRFTWLQ